MDDEDPPVEPALRVQIALARIYLDRSCRERVAAGDLDGIAGLLPSEAMAVVELVRRQHGGVELFAGLLAAKRARRVRGFLAVLCIHISVQRWERLWSDYAAGCPGDRAGTIAEDAHRFLERARRAEPWPPGEPASEALAYEQARARTAMAPPPVVASIGVSLDVCPRLGPGVELCRLRLDPQALLRGAAAAAGDFELVFFRDARHRAAPVRSLQLGPVVADLLRRADGTLPMRALIGNDRAPEALATLMFLAERGAVSW